VEVVASLCQGRTAAAQCGLFTHKSVPVIFEPPCIINRLKTDLYLILMCVWVSFLHQKQHKYCQWRNEDL